MKSIDIVDRYRVRFYKGSWSDSELFAASCVGMVQESPTTFLVDTRQVNAVSVHEFMKLAFPTILMSAHQAHFRDDLFSRLRVMYKDHYDLFLKEYYPKAKYERPLYKHQKKALSQMVHRQYNLLSFEQGLGKTITSATLSKILSVPRTIVICPSLVKWNWYHDMTDDWGYNPLYWTVLDRSKSKTVKAFRERFVVVNYEMVSKFWKHLISEEVGHIIIDECHYIKNPKTQRFKGVQDLVNHFPTARVTLLSGTPVTNRVVDLFGYCKLTGHPLGNNYKGFKERYTVTANVRGGKIIGSKNLDELRFRMSNFMIRKKTEECIDLPDLVINKYYFKADELTKEYDEVLEQLYFQNREYENADEKEKRKLAIAARANLHTLNRLVSISKAKPIADLVDKLWENGRKAIVFAGYRDALDALEVKYGRKCVKIDGSVPAHDRQLLIDKFKNDPECHVFIANFIAGGIGINLVNARDVIFMNFPFTPDQLEQPYKRAHRIGQNQKVNVYYTIAEQTIDERIFDMIVDKTQDINELVDHNKKGVVHYPQIEGILWKHLIRDYEVRTGKKQKQGLVSIK